MFQCWKFWYWKDSFIHRSGSEGLQLWLFKNASTLSTELCEAIDNYQLGKLERSLEKADLLILDELSYISFNRLQSELLYKVISDRSERSSTIVTTNLPFSKWTELFENSTMIAALVDRLTFHLHVLDMNDGSYRLKSTEKQAFGSGS